MCVGGLGVGTGGCRRGWLVCVFMGRNRGLQYRGELVCVCWGGGGELGVAEYGDGGGGYSVCVLRGVGGD